MRRRYPRLLDIRNATYSVSPVKRLEKSHEVGMCDDGNKMILLALSQMGQEFHRTFWHEVLHGMEKEYGIVLGHKIIRRLEEGIVQVIEQCEAIGDDPKQFFTVDE